MWTPVSVFIYNFVFSTSILLNCSIILFQLLSYTSSACLLLYWILHLFLKWTKLSRLKQSLLLIDLNVVFRFFLDIVRVLNRSIILSPMYAYKSHLVFSPRFSRFNALLSNWIQNFRGVLAMELLENNAFEDVLYLIKILYLVLKGVDVNSRDFINDYERLFIFDVY